MTNAASTNSPSSNKLVNAASTNSPSSNKLVKSIPKEAASVLAPVVLEKEPKFPGGWPVEPEAQVNKVPEKQHEEAPTTDYSGDGVDSEDYETVDEGPGMTEAEDKMFRALEAGLMIPQKK